MSSNMKLLELIDYELGPVVNQEADRLGNKVAMTKREKPKQPSKKYKATKVQYIGPNGQVKFYWTKKADPRSLIVKDQVILPSAKPREIVVNKSSVKQVQWNQLCVEQDKLIAKNPDVRCSQVNKTVHRAVQAKQVKSLALQEGSFSLTPENYHKIFQLLLHAEEAHEHIDMRKFDQLNARVRLSSTYNARETLYEYDLPGLSKGHPNLIPGDTVILDDSVVPQRFEIKNIDRDTIVFGRKGGVSREQLVDDSTQDFTRRPYRMSFVTSGITYDRYTDNLKNMGGLKQFQHMIFEEQNDGLLKRPMQKVKISLEATSGKIVDERLDKCNSLQRQAIQNILEASCRPNLYILFGPPGTGKTFTVVETVVQIFKRHPKARILISAGSNNCVDHLAESIFKTGQIHRFSRLSSKTHFRTLESAPQYYTTNVNQPSKFRVVLTTNMMSCRLQSSFDYVLVDEAGHAHIPESMLPMSKVGRDGCFVLAGDPKQLGPVVKCREVEKLGLGISLLERLFEFKIYSRVNGTYDAKYITKLTSSYRCDPRILELSNKLFYHGDLKSLGRTPPSILKMFKYDRPLVFSQVSGSEITPKYSTSRGNHLEGDLCIEFIFRLYLMGFEPHQVGVITPYVLQRELLIEKFNSKLQKFKSLLNDRFKLPRPPVKKKNPKEADQLKITSGLLLAEHLKKPIDNLDFLTRALGQLRLQAKSSMDKAKLESSTSSGGLMYTDWHCKIDTVDAFQGNEREIIIISTVRTPNHSGSIPNCGFLADDKRFNVAISRAKWLVVVFGHGAVLDCCDLWRQYASACCQTKSKLLHEVHAKLNKSK